MATSKKVASHLMDIPDHLLSEIFLRLPAPDDLARTSTACVSFRRIVTDRSFVRLLRRIHAPPFLGFFDLEGFHPTQPPHPSAPAARALTLAADFSFSFLPSHCGWAVEDIRDGRVLLRRRPEVPMEVSTEMVVCDPLHRLYVLLPPVPHDMPQFRSFLVPLSEEEAAAAAEETPFKVICTVYCTIKLSAFVFSSSTGQWQAAASKAWSDLFLITDEFDLMSRVYWFTKRHYAYGCFYWDWLLLKSKKLLVLDTKRMEFSMADLPPGEWSRQSLAIVEAGEGRLGMFGFHAGTAAGLSYITARNKGESPSQWQMEKTISLDPGYKYDIKDATERYLLLRRTETSSLENPLTEYFSMDIKTLKLQRVCEQGTKTYRKRIYTNFPPSLLSSPTI